MLQFNVPAVIKRKMISSIHISMYIYDGSRNLLCVTFPHWLESKVDA